MLNRLSYQNMHHYNSVQIDWENYIPDRIIFLPIVGSEKCAKQQQVA